MVHEKWVGEDKVSVVNSFFSGMDQTWTICMCSGHSVNALLLSYAMVHVITN